MLYYHQPQSIIKDGQHDIPPSTITCFHNISTSAHYDNSIFELHTDHHWEDDGQERGLEGPEDSQTDDLDQGEKMDASQRDVTQEGEVWLVFGRHEIQLDTLPELKQTDTEHAFMHSQVYNCRD